MKFLLSRYTVLLIYIPFFFLSIITLLGSLADSFDFQKMLGTFLFLEGISILTVFNVLLIEFLIERKMGKASDSTWWFLIKFMGSAYAALWFHLFITTKYITGIAAPTRMYGGAMFQIFFITILFGAFRVILKRNKEKLQLQNNFKDAQYAALKSKLNPHFLFNTLNLISSEIEYNPSNAVTLLDELSDLLRNILVLSSRKLITIEQEVDILTCYLNLQKKRFEDRLEFTLDIQNESKFLQIPPLILQPFVENAIIHGFSSKADTGIISVQIKKTDKKLLIDLKDNGKGFKVEETEDGHGISIVKETLELLYGKKQKLEMTSTPGSGTHLQITLPAQENGIS